jgi:hypothetical protein
MLVFTAIAQGFANLAQAVPERDFQKQISKSVMPFFHAGLAGKFLGVNGVTIQYKKWENPKEKGAIVVVPGRGNSFSTFAETLTVDREFQVVS